MSLSYGYKFKDRTTGTAYTIFLPDFTNEFVGNMGHKTSLQEIDVAMNNTLDMATTIFFSSQAQYLRGLDRGIGANFAINPGDVGGHKLDSLTDPTRSIMVDGDNLGANNIRYYISDVEVYSSEIPPGGTSMASVSLYSGGPYDGAHVNVAYYLGETGEYITPYNGDIPTGVVDSRFVEIYEHFWDSITPESTDPFGPGGSSGDGGGTGDFDGTSDTIPFPNDPPISATDTGFMTVFATNLAGVQSLAASLWSDLFDAIKPGGSLEGTVEALKNIVASPYDAILGCSLLPFPVATSGSKNVKLYGVLPSSVSLPVAASQWKTIDCGTLNVHEFWGAYLDYAPYTKVTSMYLPYIGVVSIDVDMIMAKTIGVKYKCDIITGQCVAIITINGSCEFSYQGQCSVPIPITSIDWSSTVNAGLGLIGSVTGIVGSAVGGALGGGGAFGALAGGVKGAMGEAGAIAQNVMNSKPDIKSGGGVGGSAGQMGIQTPFLIIERPKQSLPSIKGSDGKNYAQNHWTGYPSNIAAKLGSLKGYTEVSRVFINRTSATAEEKREIEELLYGGVYL